ncbi:MAG: hypothetical protein EON58_10825 [Alphaproteobacteria bacterium]|nr:MAG: hypothetical protein EON58_10825 [Alphaproteobacteria bacterium]
MPAVHIDHHVTHITQQDMHYCWACAFAMMKGKRSWSEALDLARRVPTASRNAENGSLLRPELAARSLYLHARGASLVSPTGIAASLERGPVSIFGSYRLADRMFKHVMVLSLMQGETDSPSTLQIGVDDPWATGARWIGTWTDFCGPGKTLLRPAWVVSR